MFPFGAHEGLGLNPALHPALAVFYCFPFSTLCSSFLYSKASFLCFCLPPVFLHLTFLVWYNSSFTQGYFVQVLFLAISPSCPLVYFRLLSEGQTVQLGGFFSLFLSFLFISCSFFLPPTYLPIFISTQVKTFVFFPFPCLSFDLCISHLHSPLLSDPRF